MGVSAQRRIDQLPAHLAPELIDACLDASRRIRLDRQVAYDCPVILKLDFGELHVAADRQNPAPACGSVSVSVRRPRP